MHGFSGTAVKVLEMGNTMGNQGEMGDSGDMEGNAEVCGTVQV